MGKLSFTTEVIDNLLVKINNFFNTGSSTTLNDIDNSITKTETMYANIDENNDGKIKIGSIQGLNDYATAYNTSVKMSYDSQTGVYTKTSSSEMKITSLRDYIAYLLLTSNISSTKNEVISVTLDNVTSSNS